MAKKYSEYWSAKACAAAIINECVVSGASEGWSGSEEELDELVEICGRFNVVYADDFRGRWEPKPPAGGLGLPEAKTARKAPYTKGARRKTK